jgi:hypothetical protein
MPKASKTTARMNDVGPVCDHEQEVAGGYVINFVEFRQDIDATPLLKGLPDDRCQCPHWGYVVKGKLTMRFPDREEVFEAGDAFYAEPGHVPIKHEPGTQIVQFSPAGKLRETQATMFKNMASMRR